MIAWPTNLRGEALTSAEMQPDQLSAIVAACETPQPIQLEDTMPALLRDKVDALGGSVYVGDKWGKGYNDALVAVIALIDAEPRNAAPTNLAEALDALQAFLPTDHELCLFFRRKGGRSVMVGDGAWRNDQFNAHSHIAAAEPLSAAYADALAKHREKVDAHTRKSDYAAAEFGPIFARAA